MGLVAHLASAAGRAERGARMTIPSQTANELAWAIETTATPPTMTRVEYRHRITIEGEYARLHRLLCDLDRAIRGWTPEGVRSESSLVPK